MEGNPHFRPHFRTYYRPWLERPYYGVPGVQWLSTKAKPLTRLLTTYPIPEAVALATVVGTVYNSYTTAVKAEEEAAAARAAAIEAKAQRHLQKMDVALATLEREQPQQQPVEEVIRRVNDLAMTVALNHDAEMQDIARIGKKSEKIRAEQKTARDTMTRYQTLLTEFQTYIHDQVDMRRGGPRGVSETVTNLENRITELTEEEAAAVPEEELAYAIPRVNVILDENAMPIFKRKFQPKYEAAMDKKAEVLLGVMRLKGYQTVKANPHAFGLSNDGSDDYLVTMLEGNNFIEAIDSEPNKYIPTPYLKHFLGDDGTAIYRSLVHPIVIPTTERRGATGPKLNALYIQKAEELNNTVDQYERENPESLTTWLTAYDRGVKHDAKIEAAKEQAKIGKKPRGKPPKKSRR